MATGLTSLLAIGVGTTAYFAHRWFVRRTQMPLVGGVLLALAFLFGLLAAPLVVEQFVHVQLGKPVMNLAFVHPAILIQLVPAIAMVIAWALVWRHYRSRAA